ncbi:MAG: hypothetical protein M1339_04185 [Bacteroidetes bacterium]|nr:hypothetical protein [Bacteroidota bacterium]
MKPTAKKFIIAASILFIFAISFMVVMPGRTKAQEQVVGNVYSKVTLYSNDGKILGTWTADGLGRMDGNTFVFNVYRGVGATNQRQVRINGTFTVEQTAP